MKEDDVFKIGRATFKIKSLFIKKTKTLKNKDLTEENNINKSICQDNSGFILKHNYKTSMLGTDGKKSANFDKEMIKDLTTKKDDMKDMLLINKFDKPKVNYICRICLSEEFDVDLNPLIHPCKCSGTMKYIHLICLKSWFKSKINVKVFNNLTLFNFRELHCELCSASIPGIW